jgi:CRISPR-associated endonuclease/helicase Cas3
MLSPFITMPSGCRPRSGAVVDARAFLASSSKTIYPAEWFNVRRMWVFESFFGQATGFQPHAHHARVARDGLPDTLRAPTGIGKTGLILAWLWRRLHGPDPVRAATPRRLIWALPQGSLLEPVAAEIRGWLAALDLTEHVALHVVTGARGENVGDWREDAHRPAIVVGTVDTLLSKALNRGFGVGRPMWPIDFALSVNGAHWVVDDARLCPQSVTTLRQVARLAGKTGTTEPFGMTLLSGRLAGPRTFQPLPAVPGDYGAIAANAAARHARGTRTLVVLNTVEAAQQVYRRLRGGPADVALLHSRFRGIERGHRLAAVTGQDLIVVATQVVEAGLGDLGAALLITEAAPWPSLVLRAAHSGTVLWVPPADPAPYRHEDIDAATSELALFEGMQVSPADLAARDGVDGLVGVGGVGGDLPAVIGRGEFLGLFDTSTYLSDDDVDIAAYVRDAGDLDLEVAWATWTPGADRAPNPEVRLPAAEYRCRIGLGAALGLADERAVWRFDQVAGAWRPVTQAPSAALRPGELLLVHAGDGGYDPETGFDLLARGPVAESPALLTPDEQAELVALAAVEALVNSVNTEEAPAADPVAVAPRAWQSLNEHSERVRDHVAALLNAIAPQHLPGDAARSAVVAGWLHDAGKAHPIWQDALCALAEEDERDEIAAGRPWAKSGGRTGRLEFAGDVPFRHELASLLLIDGPLSRLLEQAPDRDLARYLVVAHHGKLRVRIGELNGANSDAEILGLRQGARWTIPALLGRPASTLTVDLDQFTPDSAGSWTKAVAGLLTRYGPFTLAYLEAIVRIADWRASGGRELAADIDAIDIHPKAPQISHTGDSPPLPALWGAMPAEG